MKINDGGFMSKDFDIDFVIPWVDGCDPKWIKEYNKYAPNDKKKDIDAGEQRYRDYGLLKYWFRGIEKFAPWVNKIHFITCGQKPEWLNIENQKLHWVRHEDYIPKDCLPTFSSHPIELCIDRIEGVAEHIVYFNDDFFLTGPVKKEDFFKHGNPCDSAIMNAESTGNILGIIFENLKYLNKNFNKHTCIRKNFLKWFNPIYGKFLIRNFCLFLWPNFTGFYNPHLPQPYKLSNIREVWSCCEEKLDDVLQSKFRNDHDVNQWLFRYWHLCKGEFHPIHPTKKRKLFFLYEDTDKICSSIQQQVYNQICINDNLEVKLSPEEFNNKMQNIAQAFEKILPEKSSFEI